jgi:dTDP-4-dehydrorhamnose reductase
MKILIFGASGLIGNNLFSYLSDHASHEIFGTYRNPQVLQFFDHEFTNNLIHFELDESISQTSDILSKLRPDVVINALGITKHIDRAREDIVRVNSLFPHQLARISTALGIRLIHISTDCVFSGKKGLYSEGDFPDASDLYGQSKILGEVSYGDHLTVRISTIGTELTSTHGLLEWFLGVKGSCSGYKEAVFSGLPSKYFAHVLMSFILPNPMLCGLYHISSEPVDKFTLLTSLADLYGKDINIVADRSVSINRSLDSSSFSKKTGYIAPSWGALMKSEWL